MTTKSPCPMPSKLWTQYKSLQCCNSTVLSLPEADLSGKWILISGGNSGIGRESMLQCAAWGANIVIACRPNPPPREPHPEAVLDELRHMAKSNNKLKSEFEYWEVDMSSVSSVQALAKRWLDTGRPLDFLCNNAGLSSTPGRVVKTGDGFELIHQVNFLSHVLMTLTLLPAIAKAAEPRIICTTSNMQYLSTGFDLYGNANAGGPSYPNNKLYFQTWLTELQFRLAHSSRPDYRKIVVHGVHPGYVLTNIWTPKDDPGAKSMGWIEWGLQLLLPYLGITAQQGSLCISNAISAPELALKRMMVDSQGVKGARFLNRIWDCEPMPQTRHPGCRKLVWDFVDEELSLHQKGLLEAL